MLPLIWASLAGWALSQPTVLGVLEYKVEFIEWEIREGKADSGDLIKVLTVGAVPAHAKLRCTLTATGKAGDLAIAEAKFGDLTFRFSCRVNSSVDLSTNLFAIEIEPSWMKSIKNVFGYSGECTHAGQLFFVDKPFICPLGTTCGELGNLLSCRVARITVSRHLEKSKEE